MNTQNVIVTHILPTGTAFGATTGKPAESVFIPAHLATPAGVVAGEKVEVVLVPNTREPERTPWLAVKLDLLPPAARVEEVPSIERRALSTLREGGEWAVGDMAVHLDVHADRAADALQTIYNKDLCAKYQLWRKRSDTEPSDEWFTCYPDEIEFLAGAE